MAKRSLNRFDNREAAGNAAAQFIGRQLIEALTHSEQATLVVSGGTSPKHCFAQLASSKLPWDQITVMPSDERWVSPDDDASNEKLIRSTLLTDSAASASLVPLYDSHFSIDDQCERIEHVLQGSLLPFACSLLGMGTDGHFASLFPDSDHLADVLQIDGERLCIPVTTAASEHRRVSLTWSALARSKSIVLLFFGEEKMGIYDRACRTFDFPVSTVLAQDHTPVTVFWSP